MSKVILEEKCRKKIATIERYVAKALVRKIAQNALVKLMSLISFDKIADEIADDFVEELQSAFGVILKENIKSVKRKP